ncbi:leucine zipper domain-containing protein [Streptomyces sp. NPDC001634]|uniref:leucine zipper domain-containing protein n=1 Tax=Streptomyces sp. NPDC001634 TaxID=3154390 RepID=UPI00331C27A6
MARHPNAPLTREGRRRSCERVDAGRPVAHVAAEAGISRRCPAKWYARWRAHGEAGLVDHSSRPATSPARTAEDVADLIEALRRQTKHGPARLAADLKRLNGITQDVLEGVEYLVLTWAKRLVRRLAAACATPRRTRRTGAEGRPSRQCCARLPSQRRRGAAACTRRGVTVRQQHRALRTQLPPWAHATPAMPRGALCAASSFPSPPYC